jgi:hypothetical protein
MYEGFFLQNFNWTRRVEGCDIFSWTEGVRNTFALPESSVWESMCWVWGHLSERAPFPGLLFTRCLWDITYKMLNKAPLSENISYKMVMKKLNRLDLVELVDKLANLIALSTTCCKVAWQLQRKVRWWCYLAADYEPALEKGIMLLKIDCNEPQDNML